MRDNSAIADRMIAALTPKGLVKPEAWIVLKDHPSGAAADLERELIRHCKARLAPYKYPRWFHFVQELPKTATGKIQRFKLRGSHWQERSRGTLI